MARSIWSPEGRKSQFRPGIVAESGPFSLRPAKIRLYSRPSHTETWLKRPSGGSRAVKARLLTRFRRNQPENYHYGATRFLYAPAARSWRPLWSPIAPLESENGGLHFRCAQQHPHHRPRADRADAAQGATGRQRHRRQGWPHPVRRHQAAGAGWRRRSRQALGAVFRQFALARRYADQLEDRLRLDQAAAPARRDARWLRRGLAIHQEGTPGPAARA